MSKRSPSSAYRTSSDPTWRGPDRKAQTRLLIVCGAEGTEPQYIRSLNSYLCNRAVHVKVIKKGRSPSQVVSHGIKVATTINDSYDQLWCVVDVDDFDDLDVAARKVARSPIPTVLVVSNPCFELWPLLHFVDHRSHIDSPAHALRLLCKHIAGYDKKILDFARVYASGIGDAIERAKSLEPTGEATDVNPSTNVWRLVLAMGWEQHGAMSARR